MKTIDKLWLNSKIIFSQTNSKLNSALFFCTVLLMTTLPFSALAQVDSQGTDFWIMFNETFAEDPFESPPQFIDLQLFISSISGATGTVEISSIDFEESFTVGANSLITVAIPDEAMITGINTIDDLGIHITSDNPVTVYGLNQRAFTTDAYLSIPVNGWGSEYRIMAYGQGNFLNGSQMGIVANTDGTIVTITPTAAFSSNLANVPFQITLNEGETYQGRTGAYSDLTGSLITSNHPVGVFGGHLCANVPIEFQACDHLVEMLPPVSTWGQNFVTTPFAERENGDVFRVLASEDNTTITINSVLVATLNTGEFYETTLEIPSSIQTSNPALVAQYMQGTAVDGPDFPGDPAMVIVAPVEQFIGNYTVSTPATGFETNHLNIVVDNNGLGTILLNDAPIAIEEFTAIPGTNFNSAQIPIELGTYTLSSTTAFGVLVYGANPSDSYAYPGGQIYSNVVAANSLELAPADSEGPAFSELCFTATLTTDEGVAIEGVRIDFTADGANTSSGFAFTNASGVATYCYSGENVGDDELTAFQGSLSQTVDVTWTEPTYDCLGVPNGAALPGTPCELDGETGFWNEACNCEVELQSCAIEVLSNEEISEDCVDDQPIVAFTLDLFNPNNATELMVSIDYDDGSGFEDETLSFPIAQTSGELVITLTLAGYDSSANINFQMGDDENGCEASAVDLLFESPDCAPDCEGVPGGSATAGTPCAIDGQSGLYDANCDCLPIDPGTCGNYKYFLSDVLPNGVTNVFAVNFNGADAELTLIATSEIEVHIAYNEQDNLIYAVSKADGSYRTLNPATADWSIASMINGEVTEITGAVINPIGELLISSDNADAIYNVNLASKDVSVYDSYSPTIGGDLAFDAAGQLYLATRAYGGSLYLVKPDAEESDILVGSTPYRVTGMARMESDKLIMSSRDESALFVRDLDGTPFGEYYLTLNGEPFTTYYGDMASGCAFTPASETGTCHASELISYSPGLQTNGSLIDADRSNPNMALDAPDQSNAPGGFVSLGVGGSITLGFNGNVTDGPGDDLLIFETSFNGDDCSGAGDERADIAVSQDGLVFVDLGTICRDGGVDISTSGLAYVSQVRITNAASTTTLDGYDVDGVIAIHNCEEVRSPFGVAPAQSSMKPSELTSYPNPTSGKSTVTFITGETSRATLEVYDMKGQKITTLFEEEARGGEQYKLYFDASYLPGGVYMYRLITNKEIITEKFAVSK